MEEIKEAMEVAENVNPEVKTFTQDEVNNLISERLKKAEKKWQDKYSSYLSPEDIENRTGDLNKKIEELGNSLNTANDKATETAETIATKDKAIADLEQKVKTYETDSAKIRIGLENGIPFELCNKLTGTSEDEIREDAIKMLQFVTKQSAMPLRNPETPPEVDGVTKAFQALNPNLRF